MTARLEAMESIRQRKAKYGFYLDTKQFDAGAVSALAAADER